MAKNDLVRRVQKAARQGMTDGLFDGLQLGLRLSAIALNHRFGFGAKRLRRLNDEVQALVDEVITSGDPEANREHVKREVERIMSGR